MWPGHGKNEMKPRLLEAFCGGGGAGMGYSRAGFEVFGIDIEPQPNYPFPMAVGDALDYLEQVDGSYFAAVHASPPCQAYTSLRHLGKRAGEGAADLVGPTRDLLEKTGLPYVIENVMGSPLRSPVMICGSTLGLDVRRHRLFETNWPLMAPRCAHGARGRPIAVYGDHPEDSQRENLNRARTLEEGQRAMDIDWMPWKQLTQAIPPAYTELIGHQLMAVLQSQRAVA